MDESMNVEKGKKWPRREVKCLLSHLQPKLHRNLYIDEIQRCSHRTKLTPHKKCKTTLTMQFNASHMCVLLLLLHRSPCMRCSLQHDIVSVIRSFSLAQTTFASTGGSNSSESSSSTIEHGSHLNAQSILQFHSTPTSATELTRSNSIEKCVYCFVPVPMTKAIIAATVAVQSSFYFLSFISLYFFHLCIESYYY